ncbi:hypothetical protein CS0771_11930 [Catellatospora sp. IY07-71]|uniref:hypothetical protein n=1 Tax=Catellatospora sp. IY07-71 TaxID=2728827 RepID=UPI001BB43211|nr:hypothetical protein [Catellatospora sp. IY07-71]BCJ71649.1 hypothetical protein CS0771_11930 [Catellatospora sp. IY07-71]
MTTPTGPVQLRLLGDLHAVATTLAVLDQVLTLTNVSQPEPARRGTVRVYATATRRTPLTGGPR